MKQFLKASLLVTIASLLAVGLAVSAKEKKPKKQGPRAEIDAQPNPVWPPPPDTPRVKWVKFIRDEYDLGAVTKSRFLDALVGEKKDVITLKRPMAVVADAEQTVFVLDFELGLVRFGTADKTVSIIGPKSKLLLANPIGLAVDSRFVYIADSKGNRITVLDKNGVIIRQIAESNLLDWPVGLAVDEKAGLLFVVNGHGHNIVVLDKNTGKPVRSISKRGSGPGQLNFPTYVVTLPDEKIAVMDSGNMRVQMFSYTGKPQGAFGKSGDRPGNLFRPKGLAVDSDGQLWVVDSSFQNIQVFSQEGRVLTFIGQPGFGKGEFYMPLGLASSGNLIYVADQLNGRIQVLEYIPEGKAAGSAAQTAQ